MINHLIKLIKEDNHTLAQDHVGLHLGNVVYTHNYIWFYTYINNIRYDIFDNLIKLTNKNGSRFYCQKGDYICVINNNHFVETHLGFMIV